MVTMLHTCKPAFENILARELALSGHETREKGPGWILTGVDAANADAAVRELDPCFACLTAVDPQEFRANTVNALADALEDNFAAVVRGERITRAWPLLFAAAAIEGLGGRARSVEAEWRRRMSGKMARVFKLADSALPLDGTVLHGYCVQFLEFDRVCAARQFCFWGQRRMRDDPRAPSRSYLKVEEAYGILGREPASGETVADLGAAPGGWSYSALRHGARVVAVDNGPLKGGAAGHPLVTHLREDAFTFRPAPGKAFDWLFCDMIENPYKVLELLTLWLKNRWCRRFIVNLKVGHADPVFLVRNVRDRSAGVARLCSRLTVRQLHHDREEVTLVGEIRSQQDTKSGSRAPL